VTIFVTALHVLVCLILIVVVLLQRGKGAEIGAVFGGGGGSTVFGARGAGNFLTRLTSASAATFMITSLVLAYFAQSDSRSTLFEDNPPAVEEPASPFEEVPGADAAGGAPGAPFEEVAPPAEPGAAAGEAPAAAAPGEAGSAAAGAGTEAGGQTSAPAGEEPAPATP
jgi:preprotein translocase subunit SecG